MSEQPKNSRLSYLPAILAGTTALVAAASTLYVNLRDKPEPPAVGLAAPDAPVPDAAPAAAPPVAPAAPRILQLQLDRVLVDNDGSVGATDWTFQVSADEQPLFTVPMPSLSDKPGHSLARPADAAQAAADVEVPGGKSVSIQVNGWKKRLLPGSPAEVSGSAWMTLGLGKTVVTLQGAKPGGPKFVLYFSVTPTAN